MARPLHQPPTAPAMPPMIVPIGPPSEPSAAPVAAPASPPVASPTVLSLASFAPSARFAAVPRSSARSSYEASSLRLLSAIFPSCRGCSVAERRALGEGEWARRGPGHPLDDDPHPNARRGAARESDAPLNCVCDLDDYRPGR